MSIENLNSYELPAVSISTLRDIRTPSGRELPEDIQNNFSRLSPESQQDLLPEIVALLPSYDTDMDTNDHIIDYNAHIEAEKMNALTQLLTHG